MKKFSITLPEYNFSKSFFPRYYAVIRPSLWRLIITFALMVFGVLMGVCMAPWFAWGCGGGMFIYLVIWVKAYFESKKATAHLFRTILKGTGILNVDSDGIECIRNENRTTFPWDTISAIVETREYFTLFSGKIPVLLIEQELLSKAQKSFFRDSVRGRNRPA